MRYISLFSGIEAASVAWEPLGWEPAAFAEVDAFPSAVLAERFPDVPNLGDVTKVDWSEYRGKADIVVGGSPCQSFSIAGLRKGLADPRGNLMLEFLRACEQVEPEWILWENVPGVLSSNGGRDFQTLLEAVAEIWPRGGCAWRVLDAQFFGVAQRRRRVFLVVNTRDWSRAAAVLFDAEGVLGDSRSGRAKRAELTAGAGGRAEASGFKFHQGAGAGGIGFEPGQSPTLTADWHNPAVYVPGREPGGVCIQGDIARGAHMGQNGSDVSEDGSVYTLNALDVPAALVPSANPEGGSSCDSTQFECGGGRPGGGKGPLVQEEVSGTLATGNDQTIFCLADAAANAAVDEDLSGTLKSNNDRNQPVVAFAANQRGELRLQGGDGAVRRLTPGECELLQGFPKGWTRIAWRGKPPKECPDGSRYKAIGNSMCVNVMRWLGERIEEVSSW